MRRSSLVALALALAGFAALAKGVLDGDVRVTLLLVVPVVHGEGPWAFAGMLLLMAAFVAFAFSRVAASPAPEDRAPPTDLRPGESPREARGTKGGGVVLLGPIPIVFGNDPRLLLRLVLATLALVVAVALVLWALPRA
ncbi:MAG TPA: DUF131 domain-containing protein [Candidatus Thermoplasmatota archaeon]|nr:DUF131 domain-containing protein [Candidatus Thermoplasmatota archaeon]